MGKCTNTIDNLNTIITDINAELLHYALKYRRWHSKNGNTFHIYIADGEAGSLRKVVRLENVKSAIRWVKDNAKLLIMLDAEKIEDMFSIEDLMEQTARLSAEDLSVHKVLSLETLENLVDSNSPADISRMMEIGQLMVIAAEHGLVNIAPSDVQAFENAYRFYGEIGQRKIFKKYLRGLQYVILCKMEGTI